MANNTEIRKSLERCMPWLGRLIAVNSYDDEKGNPIVLPEIDGSIEALRRAEVAVAGDDGTELLATLKQCVPWMRVVVDGGYHKGCLPRDADKALELASSIIA